MINIPIFGRDGNVEYEYKEMTLEEKCEAITPEELQERVRGYTHRQLLILYNWWRDKGRYSYLYPHIPKEVGDTIEGEILRRMEGNKEAILIPNADCGEYEVEPNTARLDYK